MLLVSTQPQFSPEIMNPAQYDPLVKFISSCTHHEFTEITLLSIVLRLLCAFLLGSFLGAERATKSHAAGLRTYTLVCLGACIAVLVNLVLFQKADTARIAAAVVQGIGFIGAGTIITTTRNQIRGLTTAAALWASGIIGLAFGAGFYTVGIIGSILSIIVVMYMPRLEGKLQRRVRTFDIHVELMTRKDLKVLLDFLRSKNLRIKSIAYDPAYANTGLSVYSLAIYSEGKKNEYLIAEQVINMVNDLEYVNYCESIDQ